MTYEISKCKKKADPLSATWKFEFIETVNRDREVPPSGLKVLCAYLKLCNAKNPNPYCPMPLLIAETGLSEQTIKLARSKLVKLGYMERAGRAFGGAYRFRLQNIRKTAIDEMFERSKIEHIGKSKNYPPIEDGQNEGDKVLKLPPYGKSKNCTPYTVNPYMGGAPERDRLNINNNNINLINSHALALERARDTSEGKNNLPLADINLLFQEAIEQSALIADWEMDHSPQELDELPAFDGEVVPHPEAYDGPGTRDEIEVGRGAFVPLIAFQSSDGKAENAQGVETIVGQFVAQRVNLSKVASEPSDETIMSLAEMVCECTSIDIEDAARFVEEVLWRAYEANADDAGYIGETPDLEKLEAMNV